jgi:hypothetical protein
MNCVGLAGSGAGVQATWLLNLEGSGSTVQSKPAAISLAVSTAQQHQS